MANTKSAEKRHRQSQHQRLRNRGRKSRLRSAVKEVREAVASGDAARAQELLPATLTLFDRSARTGTIHANKAARGKSRLIKLVRSIEGGAGAAG